MKRSKPPPDDARFWAWYDEYLQTDAWREKRLQVLARARNTCEGCGLVKSTQVHHLTYERVGREMLFDLVAVCDDCHREIHRPEGTKPALKPAKLAGCTCVGTFMSLGCPHHGVMEALRQIPQVREAIRNG